MTTPQQKLISATNRLSKYFKLATFDDTLSAQKREELLGQGQATTNLITGKVSDPLLDTLLANFINSSSGALCINDLIKKLNDIVGDNADDPIVKRLNKIFQIYHEDVNIAGTSTSIKEPREGFRPKIRDLLKLDTAKDSSINASSGSPTKENPNLSIILSNSSVVSLGHRETNPIVIFLNGMPSVEMSRAVPFVDVQFFFAKSPLSKDGKLQTLSLPRFLMGTENTKDNPVLAGMASSGTKVIAGKDPSGKPISTTYSSAGMEIFTSPQTLINANLQQGTAYRTVPVLDKFRPFMSLKNFETSVLPTKGLMSFKSGQLSFVLHDRSRLAEIAEMIRPDLYSRHEIQIEYGWSHPDANNPVLDNPYADLINGMRVKEKYNVINSSFTFDEVGQANITLKIVMMGGTELETQQISSDSDSFGTILEDINRLQEAVGEYKAKVLPDNEVGRMKEIKGIQILDAAQDPVSQMFAGKELKKTLDDFAKAIGQKTTDATALIKSLQGLLDKQNELGKSITEKINDKVKKLQGSEADPWLLDNTIKIINRNAIVKAPRTLEQTQKLKEIYGNHAGINSGSEVSLAKLMLNFLAEPLAHTKKFDDIQLVFYPFNDCAGGAKELNIANFHVNLAFFLQEYRKYRLEHIGKTGNLSLRQFLDFVSDILLDDPAATSYGLTNLFREVTNEDGTQRSVEIKDSITQFQSKVNATLSGNPFKSPQIDFYLEALPEVVGRDDLSKAGGQKELLNNKDAFMDTGRTILRIHVFDKVTTSYSALGALLASSRDREMEQLNKELNEAGVVVGKNDGISDEKKRLAAKVLSGAKSAGLIEQVGDTDTYSIKGGINQLKEFIMTSIPYIIFGTTGTQVKAANLSSVQDPALSTINILRNFNITDKQVEQERMSGLPLRISPTELSMTINGCPLINYAQQFFIDFQTGTTADSIYSVVGLTNKFNPGEFTTDIKFTPGDAWGRYISLIQRVNHAKELLEALETKKNDGNANKL